MAAVPLSVPSSNCGPFPPHGPSAAAAPVAVVLPATQSRSPPPSELPQIPWEPWKLSFLLGWFMFAVVSNWVVLAYVHDLISWEPMPDLLFVVPQLDWAAGLADWMVRLSFISLCLLIVLHRQRLLLLRRTLFLLALLNTLRSLMILLTRLPSSFADNAVKCRERVNVSDWSIQLLLHRTLEQAIRLGLQDGNQKLLCGDQFFSGHTAMMTLCALLVDYYVPLILCPRLAPIIRSLPKLFACVGIPCMVLSRGHYSVDVLAGYFLTVTTFSIYHSICEMPERSARHNCVQNRTLLMAKLICWLEKEMPTKRLPDEFELPLHKYLARRRWLRWKVGPAAANVNSRQQQQQENNATILVIHNNDNNDNVNNNRTNAIRR